MNSNEDYFDYRSAIAYGDLIVPEPIEPSVAQAEMTAIEPTALQRFLGEFGVTLEDIGKGLENMPPIQIRRTGQTLDMKDLLFGIGARDLFPFIGQSEDVPVDEMRTMTGKPIDVYAPDGGTGEFVEQPSSGQTVRREFGTPQVLQQMGRGISPVVGKGMTTELTPDAKRAAFDLMEFTGISKTGKAGKAAVKGKQ
jgi:hypothetical protein